MTQIYSYSSFDKCAVKVQQLSRDLKQYFLCKKRKNHIKIFIKNIGVFQELVLLLEFHLFSYWQFCLFFLQHDVTATENLKYKVHFAQEQNLCNFKFQNRLRCLTESSFLKSESEFQQALIVLHRLKRTFYYYQIYCTGLWSKLFIGIKCLAQRCPFL